MKELRINVTYLAETYGFDYLEDARIVLEEDGRFTMILEGTSKSEPA
jgi:hypothetical protein